MKTYEKISENIYSVKAGGINDAEAVYIVRVLDEALLFCDGGCEIYPLDEISLALDELKIKEESLRYLFLSDGVYPEKLIARFPSIIPILRGGNLIKHPRDRKSIRIKENKILLGVLRAVKLTGCDALGAGLIDMRDNTLLSGSCLLMYGRDGASALDISHPKQYTEAIEQLYKIEISAICASSSTRPYGVRVYRGKSAVIGALDACLAPFVRLRAIIRGNTALSDKAICAEYNKRTDFPPVDTRLVASVRRLYEEK